MSAEARLNGEKENFHTLKKNADKQKNTFFESLEHIKTSCKYILSNLWLLFQQMEDQHGFREKCQAVQQLFDFLLRLLPKAQSQTTFDSYEQVFTEIKFLHIKEPDILQSIKDLSNKLYQFSSSTATPSESESTKKDILQLKLKFAHEKAREYYIKELIQLIKQKEAEILKWDMILNQKNDPKLQKIFTNLESLLDLMEQTSVKWGKFFDAQSEKYQSQIHEITVLKSISKEQKQKLQELYQQVFYSKEEFSWPGVIESIENYDNNPTSFVDQLLENPFFQSSEFYVSPKDDSTKEFCAPDANAQGLSVTQYQKFRYNRTVATTRAEKYQIADFIYGGTGSGKTIMFCQAVYAWWKEKKEGRNTQGNKCCLILVDLKRNWLPDFNIVFSQEPGNRENKKIFTEANIKEVEGTTLMYIPFDLEEPIEETPSWNNFSGVIVVFQVFTRLVPTELLRIWIKEYQEEGVSLWNEHIEGKDLGEQFPHLFRNTAFPGLSLEDSQKVLSQQNVLRKVISQSSILHQSKVSGASRTREDHSSLDAIISSSLGGQQGLRILTPLRGLVLIDEVQGMLFGVAEKMKDVINSFLWTVCLYYTPFKDLQMGSATPASSPSQLLTLSNLIRASYLFQDPFNQHLQFSFVPTLLIRFPKSSDNAEKKILYEEGNRLKKLVNSMEDAFVLKKYFEEKKESLEWKETAHKQWIRDHQGVVFHVDAHHDQNLFPSVKDDFLLKEEKEKKTSSSRQYDPERVQRFYVDIVDEKKNKLVLSRLLPETLPKLSALEEHARFHSDLQYVRSIEIYCPLTDKQKKEYEERVEQEKKQMSLAFKHTETCKKDKEAKLDCVNISSSASIFTINARHIGTWLRGQKNRKKEDINTKGFALRRLLSEFHDSMVWGFSTNDSKSVMNFLERELHEKGNYEMLNLQILYDWVKRNPSLWSKGELLLSLDNAAEEWVRQHKDTPKRYFAWISATSNALETERKGITEVLKKLLFAIRAHPSNENGELVHLFAGDAKDAVGQNIVNCKAAIMFEGNAPEVQSQGFARIVRFCGIQKKEVYLFTLVSVFGPKQPKDQLTLDQIFQNYKEFSGLDKLLQGLQEASYTMPYTGEYSHSFGFERSKWHQHQNVKPKALKEEGLCYYAADPAKKNMSVVDLLKVVDADPQMANPIQIATRSDQLIQLLHQKGLAATGSFDQLCAKQEGVLSSSFFYSYRDAFLLLLLYETTFLNELTRLQTEKKKRPLSSSGFSFMSILQAPVNAWRQAPAPETEHQPYQEPNPLESARFLSELMKPKTKDQFLIEDVPSPQEFFARLTLKDISFLILILLKKKQETLNLSEEHKNYVEELEMGVKIDVQFFRKSHEKQKLYQEERRQYDIDVEHIQLQVKQMTDTLESTKKEANEMIRINLTNPSSQTSSLLSKISGLFA